MQEVSFLWVGSWIWSVRLCSTTGCWAGQKWWQKQEDICETHKRSIRSQFRTGANLSQTTHQNEPGGKLGGLVPRWSRTKFGHALMASVSYRPEHLIHTPALPPCWCWAGNAVPALPARTTQGSSCVAILGTTWGGSRQMTLPSCFPGVCPPHSVIPLSTHISFFDKWII